MAFPLRLSEQPQKETPLALPPETLLKHLTTSIGNLEELLQDLHCSPQDLAQTLNSPQTAELLKLKTNLATLQLKLLALQYLPHAFAKLITLMNTSEKPEVARRAATTVLALAGVPTQTAPAKADPAPLRTQDSELRTEEKPSIQLPVLEGTHTAELLEAVAQVIELKAKGIDLSTVPDSQVPDLLLTLQKFTTQT